MLEREVSIAVPENGARIVFSRGPILGGQVDRHRLADRACRASGANIFRGTFNAKCRRYRHTFKRRMRAR
jgi:hypothetical protein